MSRHQCRPPVECGNSANVQCAMSVHALSSNKVMCHHEFYDRSSRVRLFVPPPFIAVVIGLFDQVRTLLEVQADTLESTKRQVDKKQTRTVEERDQEIEEEEQGVLPEFNEVRTHTIVCV